MEEYQLDSIGWGSPFLIVPEVCDVDETTLQLLEEAQEEDLRLSHASPLGVRFNNLEANTRDADKWERLEKGEPGSICTKRFMVANTEFTDKPICTASRQYQKLKLEDLKSKNLSQEEYNKEVNHLLEKTCLCKGLATASLLVNKIDTGKDGNGVSICPGPNLAYFNKRASLKEMIDHIYNKGNLLDRKDRPNLFLKELGLYIDYLKEQVGELNNPLPKQIKTLERFQKNLFSGINYYKELGNKVNEKFHELKVQFEQELESKELELKSVMIRSEK
jgi:hypothetical protein